MHTKSLEIAKGRIDTGWVTRIKCWLQGHSAKNLHITDGLTHPAVFGGVIYVIAVLERLEEAWAANTQYVAERNEAQEKLEALQRHADRVTAKLQTADKALTNRAVDLQFLVSSLQSKCDKQRADITRLTKNAEANASLVQSCRVKNKALTEQRDACYEKLPALTQWGLCQQFPGMKMDILIRALFDRPFTSADENREAAKTKPYNAAEFSKAAEAAVAGGAVSSMQDTDGCTQSAATPVSTLTDRVGRLEQSVFGRTRG